MNEYQEDSQIMITELGCRVLAKARKRKYNKRSPYWRITLRQRIRAAYQAFKRGR